VDHARAYSDPATQKTRQIDIVASLHRSVKPDEAGASLHIVVECKKSTTPWVVFTAPRNVEYPSFESETVADVISRDVLWQTVGSFHGTSILLQPVGGLGHGAVRVNFANKQHGAQPKEERTEAEYPPFVALQEVLSAARALGTENEYAWKQEHLDQYLEIVVPIVVLDAPLFTFELTPEGTSQLLEVDFVKMLVPKAQDYGVAVPILTLKGLTKVLEADTPVFGDMCRWISEHNVKVRRALSQTHSTVDLSFLPHS